MENSRWKVVKSAKDLKSALERHPGSYIEDTGDKERRFYLCLEDGTRIMSVDGRSVRVSGVRVEYVKGKSA